MILRPKSGPGWRRSANPEKGEQLHDRGERFGLDLRPFGTNVPAVNLPVAQLFHLCILPKSVARRIVDRRVLHLIKMWCFSVASRRET
jgi:hypothetical protein